MKAGEYKDKAVYEIGIAGSYPNDKDPNNLDLYVARFNTRANFTTNFYESDSLDTAEYAKSVYIDLEHDRIYAVVDINTNKYYERTVYEPGEEPGHPNPNIAIFAFSFDFGTRLWVSVIGDSSNIDTFSGLSMYNGHLHVALTSHTDQYSTDESQTDIIYTKIRSDNGHIVSKKIFGSPKEDKALDIVATTAGVYLMTVINDNFLPHPVAGNIWQTNGGAGKTNFAILLIRDSDSQLVDIEGYDIATMTGPYPKRFSAHITTGIIEFIFYSPRANTDIAGLYFSKFTDQLKFVNNAVGACTDNTNCDKCNNNDPDMCMICKPTKVLFNNK